MNIVKVYQKRKIKKAMQENKDKTNKEKRAIIIKRIKNILLFLFSAIMIISMMDPNFFYKVEMKKAMWYLEKKYGGNFIAKGYESADFLSDIDTVFCYEETMNPEYENLKVKIIWEDGKKKYRDNYFGYVVRPEVEAWVAEIVETQFDNPKVYMADEASSLPDDLTRESTLKDLYERDPGYLISTYIYVQGDADTPMEAYEKKAKELEKKFLETGKSFWLLIFVVNEEIYESVERYTQQEYSMMHFRYFRKQMV